MNKAQLREKMRTLRSKISKKRKEQAAKDAFFYLEKKLQPYAFVLSFYSFPSELSLHSINAKLSLENKLLLPRVEGKELSFYPVNNLQKQVILSANKIREPHPDLCKKILDLKELPILIPGLAFTLSEKSRIGYGKGYYDRFLSKHQDLEKIGIGFEEQQVESLPTDKWDVSLDRILLF
jgi:5-formyltetrahydrofolate cyclo-ligase